MQPGSLDARLIDLLQAGLTITERPFGAVATHLGIDEQQVIERVKRLLDDGVLSRFGPMYNADRLGGAYSLCAMSIPQADFERIAAIINTYPEVAHNYAREHALNMWFVIATENKQGIDDVIANIEHRTGLEVFNFPKEEEYFVGLRLPAHGNSDVSSSRESTK